jgi:flagellar protein FlaF
VNAISQARRAYSASAAPTRSARSIEYETLARITHRLQRAAQQGPMAFADLAAALHDNRRLWGIFAAEVADRDNPLPEDLKARIFYLAEFTLHHTPLVLSGKSGVDPLLDVNTAVMRGLRGEAA